jgi:hypothetical protein
LKESAKVLRNNNAQTAEKMAKVSDGRRIVREDIRADIRNKWGRPSHSRSRNWRWGVALAGIA